MYRLFFDSGNKSFSKEERGQMATTIIRLICLQISLIMSTNGTRTNDNRNNPTYLLGNKSNYFENRKVHLLEPSIYRLIFNRISLFRNSNPDGKNPNKKRARSTRSLTSPTHIQPNFEGFEAAEGLVLEGMIERREYSKDGTKVTC